MKILILGAGQVGTSVASSLASENNDITVVDTDHQRLRDLAEKLDIRTVVGHASLPSVLSQAGAEEAELLVAVTSSDEIRYRNYVEYGRRLEKMLAGIKAELGGKAA